MSVSIRTEVQEEILRFIKTKPNDSTLIGFLKTHFSGLGVAFAIRSIVENGFAVRSGDIWELTPDGNLLLIVRSNRQ